MDLTSGEDLFMLQVSYRILLNLGLFTQSCAAAPRRVGQREPVTTPSHPSRKETASFARKEAVS